MRITPNNITKLKPNEIFVFGSNESGIHGAGAAKLAREQFGAILGKGYGLQGQSYAIPTKGPYAQYVLNLDKIQTFVNKFIEFSKTRPDLIFLVTEIGCGLAGYKPKDIAPLFKDAQELENIYLPEKFIRN
jgi:hypothetical protein